MENAQELLTLYVNDNGQTAIKTNTDNPMELIGMLEMIKSNILKNTIITSEDESSSKKETPVIPNPFKSKYEA